MTPFLLGFVNLVYLALSSFGLALIAASIIGLIASFCVARRVPGYVLAILIFLSCLPAGTVFGFIFWNTRPTDITSKMALLEAYQLEFGQWPTESVTDIRCRQYAGFASVSAWMTFNADPATVDALLSRFKPLNDNSAINSKLDGPTPEWWKPKLDGMTRCYRAENWQEDFLISYALLAHDAKKQQVYFYHHSGD